MYLLVLVIGTILLLASIMKFKDSMADLRQGVRVEAVVVDQDAETEYEDGKRRIMYRPIFRFTTLGGEEVEWVSEISSSPPSYKIGDREMLLYNPADTTRVTTFGYWGVFRWPLIILLLGTPFLIIGGGYFVALMLFRMTA